MAELRPENETQNNMLLWSWQLVKEQCKIW